MFRTLFEALQLQACGMTTPADEDKFRPPSYPTPAGLVLYVDPKGDDDGDGSIEKPLRTIAAAVSKLAGHKDATIQLRGGTHYLGATLELGPADSWLTIANADGEAAVLSGGHKLSGLSWQHSARCGASCWEADLSHLSIDDVPGLRVDGVREIRARWPNFDPERSSVIDGRLMTHDGRR